ncbi:hypothetical protein [Sphingosinicella sp.]|uniref:hypothetical protein n=1 Tax=Sphingosinicella sp. TaxID=1917971 RepID=UPI00403807FB
MLTALLVPLALAALVTLYALIRSAAQRGMLTPNPEAVVLGAITNFFDTLGIGSFAPTMAWLKFRRLVPDRLIPCILLPAHGLPAMAQSAIYLVLLGVLVEPVLLFGCVISFALGVLIGAPLVIRTKVWVVQLVVAFALVAAASFYALGNLGLMPAGGTAASLPPLLIVVAIAANFLFGILINFGVGHYAPTLVLLSLMGMNPRLCFPIMATAGALAVPGSMLRHIAIGEIDLRIVIGVTLGGVPAVLVAAFLVQSMPIELLRWLVIVVVLYAAAIMLRASLHGRRGVADEVCAEV